MNGKIAIGACALLAVGGFGLKRAWPWIAPPPLAAEEVDARWSSLLELAEVDASCGGDAHSWDALVDSASELSIESRDLIRERTNDELPLPRAALPADVQAALEALAEWHRNGGKFETLDDPLEMHTLQQAYRLLEDPSEAETTAVLALASRELRCGSAVEFAIGLATAREFLESNTPPSAEQLSPLVLSQSEMVAVVAREAEGMWNMMDALGDEDVASELGAPRFVGMNRELNMFRWYYGEVIDRALAASSMSEAAEATGWMFGPERKSVIVSVAAPNLSSILEEYVALHAELTAGG